jgi:heavy metal sensor kinase
MRLKSIRLSLVVYFLVLLTAALGAVSCLVYDTTAAAINERRLDARKMIDAQHLARCEEARVTLDRRILRQAQTIAVMARSELIHFEGLYPLGVMGTPFVSQPHLNAPLWLAEGAFPPLAVRLHRMHPAEINVEAADDLLPPPAPNARLEYFLVYGGKGQLLKRSRSFEGRPPPLDEALAETAEPLHEHFDTVDLGGGHRVRQVTLKTSVTRYHASAFPWPWRWAPGKGGGGKGGGPPPTSSGPPTPSPPGPPPRPFVVETEAPVIFIQYGSDIAPLEAKLSHFADERNERIAQLDEDTEAQLQTLRGRLLWIALLTFAGTVVGGYLLLRLGLAPLHRLSDAVSQVSERDFRLKVEPRRLPAELQPIAERLSHTLEQLGRAFDREKQAAADISHELRTPLAALLTTIDVALRKARSVTEYQEILEECRSSGRQMSLLVERLLALARLDAGAVRVRPRTIDAAELALQCADLVRPLAKARDLTLQTHVPPTLPVQTDPDKLREVLTNLLHNAVEYNRPGGSIDLSVERADGRLCVEVRDSGIGISPEARERIFERFFRADPSRHADTPHAGLGLAIVKSYVDLLGGTVSVESVPQQGTTFRVCLPVQEPAPEEITVLA